MDLGEGHSREGGIVRAFPPGVGPAAVLLPLLCLGPLLLQVVGLGSQEEYNVRSAVASSSNLVADELDSLPFKVAFYT